MNTRFPSCLLFLGLWLLLPGCAPQKAAFDVMVKNGTVIPITVGFVKRGPPGELKWASPEDFTNLPPSRQPPTWGEVLAAGQTASVHIDGLFERGSQPFLRIYGGEHTLSDLLSISRNTGDRLDLALTPGPNNRFIISDSTGKFTARLLPLAPPRPAPPK